MSPRGDVVLGSFILRPSFAALAEIEQKLGMGLLAVARKCAAGEATTFELLTIVKALAVELPEATEDELQKLGLLPVLEAVLRVLTDVLTGDA